MLVRIAFGVGLVALGYFVGREVGRNEPLRRALDQEPWVGPGPEKAPGPEGSAQSDRANPEGGRRR
ncbi:MAG: hypothetical protein H6R22_615 [Chromatiaceae bacterium]|jgi:hypothetical protein|nr:hypothetical protein [Chromatiaceae bacterium]